MTQQAKRINLALQGGGAHGAFTWGVLDTLLDTPSIEIEAISGTSAGAMNAVIMADGLVAGGPQVARRKLETFWRAVAEAARFSPLQRSPWDRLIGNWSLDHSPGHLFFDLMTRFWAPSQFNPLKYNPLRDILVDQVNFDNVGRCKQLKLFIAATNATTGRVKIFNGGELTPDMVMASACLPFLFEAVEIDGVPYWDGGYSGNPPLFPFYRTTDSRDILIVQINPVAREHAPVSAVDILNRTNEITFNASLLKELRALNFVKRLIREGTIDSPDYRDMLVHIIDSQDLLKPLGASSKLNAEWEFLCHLRDLGRQRAEEWIAQHYDDIGERDSVDLPTMFAG
ncbi:patatin-like phospholipase family protein [Halomonas cupida]|uniref:Alpha/beta hydrolase n=1 Tax=Halomonas cupida TaxID=44933 RepID=A0A1M7J133_9GAMM|nr:patatin-like phospholipase family protein [Halomonas cupida]GEN24275.1 alpha/beta hydrolase [Halomonas cupida]SHM46774.1 NTE family protein [Halomonas cupida]